MSEDYWLQFTDSVHERVRRLLADEAEPHEWLSLCKSVIGLTAEDLALGGDAAKRHLVSETPTIIKFLFMLCFIDQAVRTPLARTQAHIDQDIAAARQRVQDLKRQGVHDDRLREAKRQLRELRELAKWAEAGADSTPEPMADTTKGDEQAAPDWFAEGFANSMHKLHPDLFIPNWFDRGHLSKMIGREMTQEEFKACQHRAMDWSCYLDDRVGQMVKQFLHEEMGFSEDEGTDGPTTTTR
jgi:hypothetical protein